MIETLEAQRLISEWAVRKGWRGEAEPKVIDCDNDGKPLPGAVPKPRRTFGDELILQVSELVEALECSRDDSDLAHVWFAFEVKKAQDYVSSASVGNGPMTEDEREIVRIIEKFSTRLEGFGVHAAEQPLAAYEWDMLCRAGIAKPEGVPVELADTVIRVLDTCEAYGIDLGFEIRRKMEYNETRAFRHGGRRM